MASFTVQRAASVHGATVRAPRRGRVVVRAATALPAEVGSRVDARQCASMQVGSTARSADWLACLPAGEDRHPRGRPRVCQGGGGGGQDRGRHPAAQHGAEAAHAGHRAVGGQRQGGEGAPQPAGCCPCILPHAASHPNPSLPLLQVGDKVVYSKYAGTEIELQGDNFVLLKVRAVGSFWMCASARGAAAASCMA